MPLVSKILLLIFLSPVFLSAVILHEIAHGWVADRLGDHTAKDLGRLSFNPLRHISWVGSVLLPTVLVLIKSPVLLAWAKPVPIDARNFKRPLQDMGWVAVAGPVTNLILALLFALAFRSTQILPESHLKELGSLFLQYGVMINVALAMFNLLPIPPLDGSRIVTAFLPLAAVEVYARLERVGILIVFALLYIGWLDWLTVPVFKLIGILLGKDLYGT